MADKQKLEDRLPAGLTAPPAPTAPDDAGSDSTILAEGYQRPTPGAAPPERPAPGAPRG